MAVASCIGLVVPHLLESGGVATVARFLKDAIVGSDRYELRIISLATASRDPCNVSITRPSTWRRGAVARSGTWDGLPYIHVGAIGGELEVQRFRPRRVLAEAVADCDILQVVCGIPAWANAVCGLNKPVSVQTATLARVERQRSGANATPLTRWRQAMTRFIDPIDRRALRSVDAIQVENPWMLELARDLNAARTVDIRFAPPGVDAVRFAPLDPRPFDDAPYILCVGRFGDPRKNVALLLAAFARLTESHRDLRLVLAGASAPPKAFWERAAALKIQHRVEYVASPTPTALVELYQHARAFALSSHEEGLGVVLLEAMACGVPVVSTRSGGPDGLITHNHDGFLVELDDVAGFATCLGRLCSNRVLNIEMGKRARETIEARYSKTAAVKPFFEVWDKLLASAWQQSSQRRRSG